MIFKKIYIHVENNWKDVSHIIFIMFGRAGLVIGYIAVLLNLTTIITGFVNPEEQLRFDILKDIYLTKKAETEEIKTKTERKAFEQKILNLITEKEEDSLKGKSIEELKAMLDS